MRRSRRCSPRRRAATSGEATNSPSTGDPRRFARQCETSLRALAVDCIDLYQLHWPDPRVPLAETMGAFAELRSEGKIRFVGLANVTVEEIEEAQRVVDVVSVQNSPSPMRLEARAALDYCEAYDIAYLAYASLGGPSEAKTLAARLPAFAAAVLRHAVSPQRVVLCLGARTFACAVTIAGAGRPKTAADSAAAATLQLEADELELLTSSLPGASRALGRRTADREVSSPNCSTRVDRIGSVKVACVSQGRANRPMTRCFQTAAIEV
jgi:aryl-alcohol dehydrogenase-like predicted oxidoreductase